MATTGEANIYKTFAKEINSTASLVQKAKNGLPVKVFEQLSEATALSPEQLSSLINTSSKTIRNYRAKQAMFDRPTSEHLLLLIGLYKKGQQLFTEVAAFNQWLHIPAYGLGGEVPYTMLHTAKGIDLVMEELYRIEFGALA